MPAKKKAENLRSVMPSGREDDSFFALVYTIVRQVPHGRVTTFGAIAAALGAKSSARMVGWALNNAHAIKPPVPAHRVVNRKGMLSGKMHFGAPNAMQQALEAEGVCIKGDAVYEFEKRFWDPAVELDIAQ